MDFRKWIRRRPCDICHQGIWNQEKGRWENDVFHIQARGMGGNGQKCADIGNVLTACRSCHQEFGTIGQSAFEQKRQVDLQHIADQLKTIWEVNNDVSAL